MYLLQKLHIFLYVLEQVSSKHYFATKEYHCFTNMENVREKAYRWLYDFMNVVEESSTADRTQEKKKNISEKLCLVLL